MMRLHFAPLTLRERPIIIGHRGFSADAPENTLASFKLALTAGADAVELDYRQSKDGIPVVIHDEWLDRTTNARQRHRRRVSVQELTAAELSELDAGSWFHVKFAGERIPLLTDALKFIHESGGVSVVERKSGDAVTLARILTQHGLGNEVVVISFDWRFLRELHELLPSQSIGALGPPVYLSNGKRCRRSETLSESHLNEAAETGAKIAVWNRKVSKTSVHLAHERAFHVWVYTIDSVRTARSLVEIGVDGIISNNPRSIAQALREGSHRRSAPPITPDG